MLSAIIIAYNEAANIADCLASLDGVCDDIVIADSGSTDGTREIAEKMGARVIVQPFLGDGPQRNLAASHARNDWIVCLDADERLSPELRDYLKTHDVTASGLQGFTVRRRNYVMGRWVRYNGWYPDRLVRIYDRRELGYTDKFWHAANTGERVGQLEQEIIHHSYASVGALLNPYRHSCIGALMLYRDGRKAGPLTALARGSWTFFRSYILKRGILGGLDGFHVALAAGYGTYQKYAILHELRSDPERLKHYTSFWPTFAAEGGAHGDDAKGKEQPR
ncbi:MAG: glycosyltransferase family 2 protein [Rhodobiaceae bacterium]|nr:glycosyltransferase family 2 protein [Paracoccaceae bacterium]MCC0041156.1 glycosyltransferase family 2 protein [Rhodobiaceae bacterium]